MKYFHLIAALLGGGSIALTGELGFKHGDTRPQDRKKTARGAKHRHGTGGRSKAHNWAGGDW